MDAVLDGAAQPKISYCLPILQKEVKSGKPHPVAAACKSVSNAPRRA
jgi:hypothetical protein